MERGAQKTIHTNIGWCFSREWNLNVLKIAVYMVLNTWQFKDRQPGHQGIWPILAKNSSEETEAGKQSFPGLYSHWISSKPLYCCVAGKENWPVSTFAEQRISSNTPALRKCIAHCTLFIPLIKIMCGQKWKVRATQVLTTFWKIRK